MALPTRAEIRRFPALAFGGELIGRAAERAVIAEWLDDPRQRLLTITGQGGVGKTHLAYHALQAAPESLGVAFVSLAPVASSDLMLPAIGRALGLDGHSGAPLLDLLGGALGEPRTVLALDNLEHLHEAGAIVASLLAAYPALKLLATSRAPLNLRAEAVLVLEALPLPARDGAPHVEEIEGNPAVQLFIQRVRRVDRGFRLTPENAAMVVEICRRLDGLPLAIELISSRVATLSLATMLARMDDQLGLLRARQPDAPPRQWSMQASIAWSLDLLSDNDRTALQRLAIFPGLFSAEDARAIADVPLESLEALASHHLVLQRRDDGLADAFQLAEPVKQYCRDALQAAGEEARWRTRHARAIAQMVEVIQAQLITAARKEALKTLIGRLDDINAALTWSLAQNDLATTIRIATGMRHGWAVVVHWSVGLRWLREILAAIDRSGFVDDEAVTALLLTAGLVALHAEQYEESRRSFARAVELSRASGDRHRLIDALIRSIPTLIELRRLDDAEELLAEAMQLIDASTPEKSVQMASTQLGILSLHQGNHARALTSFQPGLIRAQITQNPHSLAFHQRLIGDALHELGEREESREFYLAAIEAQAGERSTHYFLAVLGLARLELAAGRARQAAHWLAEYLEGRQTRREEKRAREGLFEVARLAHLQERADLVAEFLGAANSGPRVMLPGDRALLERTMVNAARSALGEVRFNALTLRGQSQSLATSVEAAISYAAEIAGQSQDDQAMEPDPPANAFQLTSRELQVLRCLAEGKSDREIGDTLYISHQTASTHVRNILRKLDAPSRSMAVVIAVRNGLVSLSQESA